MCSDNAFKIVLSMLFCVWSAGGAFGGAIMYLVGRSRVGLPVFMILGIVPLVGPIRAPLGACSWKVLFDPPWQLPRGTRWIEMARDTAITYLQKRSRE